MNKQKCSKCIFLDVPRGRDGKMRVFRRYSYRCTCPVRETDINLPYSMAKFGKGYFIPGPYTLSVKGDDGESCPRFVLKDDNTLVRSKHLCIRSI